MKQEHTQEEDSYAAEFINLFGKDTATHASSNSNNIINNNYNNNNGMGSAHPLDQFVATASSSSSLPVVAARSNTELYDHAVTPEILLEQLAYVDNFIPSLDNEFSNVDWNVNTTHNNINSNGTNTFSNINANPFDLDEQLAIELSAFADDSFIFPDEDKPRNSNNCDNDDNDDDVLHEDALPNNNRQRNPHFLTQRRNTFLTSQYDQSKSRFSSRNKTNDHNGETNNFDNSEHENHNFQPSFMTSPPQFPVSAANAASTDHGAFTNVDISSHGDSAAANSNTNGNTNNNNNNNVDTLSHLLRRTTHTPNRSSPLSHVASAQNISQQRQPDTKTSIDSNNDSNGSNKSPNITIPDYSIIPTSVLVTLLPRVNVPKGAYNSLVAAGFDNDQIDAIAAIMAYHHQKKSRENNNNTSNGNTSVSQEAPILKNINELLNVLIPSSSTDIAIPSSSPTSSSSFNEHGVVAEASFLSSILELGVNHSKSNNIHNERQSTRNDNNTLIKENGKNNNIDNNNNNNGATSNSNTNPNNEIAKIRSEPTLNVGPSTHKEKVLKRSHSGDLKDEKLPIERKYSDDDEDDDDDDADLPSHKRKQFIKKELEDDDDDLLIQSKKSHQRKKVKEKELESSIHELTEIAVSLQKRIHTLETENKLLKNLVLSSGETEGIKKAESLKKQILEKVQKE